VRFIHLNHSNPALHEARIVDQVRARGFAVARQGESVRL